MIKTASQPRWRGRLFTLGSILAAAGLLLTFATAASAPTGPALTISPASITAGDSVSISGSGFNPGESVNLFFPGNITTFTADSSGNFNTTGYHSEATLAAATYNVVAVGITSGVFGSANLTVAAASPSLTVSGPIGAGLTTSASVSGFGSGESVCVSYASACQTLSGGSGSVSLQIPAALPAGTYTLRAYGQTTGRHAFSTLQVTAAAATISASPNAAAPGQTVNLTASGFQSTESIQFYSGPLNSTVTASGGSASSSFTVPCALGASSLTLVALGQTSGLMAATNLPLSAAPEAVSAPSSAALGSSVTISGSGWASGENVTLTGPFTTESTTVTATGGSFSSIFTIPASIPNISYTVDAYGQTSQCDAQATISTTGTPTGGPLTLGSNTPGQPLTISGGGFTPNETVTVSTPFGANFSTTASGTGAISTSVVVPVGFPTGTYAISAAGASVTATSAVSLGAASSFNVAPSPVVEGSSANFSVSGFSPAAAVTFNMPGLASNATTATADASGNASAAATVSTGIPGGTYFASASQSVNQSRPMRRAVTLSAGSGTTINLGPNPASLSRITGGSITGSGFSGNELVDIYGPLCFTTCTVLSNGQEIQAQASAGSFGTSYSVRAEAPNGTYAVIAVGETSHLVAVQQVTISGTAAAVTVSPSSGALSTTISVAATGLHANEPVNLNEGLGGLNGVVADGTGAVNTTFAISNCFLSGTYAIAVIGVGSNTTLLAPLTVSNGSTSIPSGCAGFALPSTPVPGTNTVSTGGGAPPPPATVPLPGGVSCSDPSCAGGVVITSCTDPTACPGAPVLLTPPGGVPGGPPPNAGVLPISALQNLPGFPGGPLPAGGPGTQPPGPPPFGFGPPPPGAPGGPPLPPGAPPPPAPPPPIPPQFLNAPGPVQLAAQIPATTGGIIIAGNVGLIVQPSALQGIPGGQATFTLQPHPPNVPVPGGNVQYSPHGTILDISITDKNGKPVTTFAAPIPIVFKYNAADVGQARNHPENLAVVYVIDENSPAIENPLHFPLHTFVLFPPSHTSLNLKTQTITILAQGVGSVLSVVSNPVEYVQTLTPNTPELSSFDPGTSQTFGTKPQFSYLQVVEPQIGNRLLVLDPNSGNYSYVNATDVGPSGPPPTQSSSAVVRGLLGQQQAP